MQEQFGYPAFTAADKDFILSTNARELYGVPERMLRTADRERDRSWVTNASAMLSAAIASVR